MKIRTTALHFILALLLLLSQQLAVLHANSHAISHAEIRTASVFQNDGLPGDSVCDQCVALGSLSSTLKGAFSFGLSAIFTHTKISLEFHEHVLPALLRPFNSRAPPVL